MPSQLGQLSEQGPKHQRQQQPTENNTEETPLLSSPTKPSYHVKYSLRLILPALWIGSFLSALDSTIVANTLTSISEDFHKESMKSWIATSYLLTNCSFQPLYGKVSDIIGRKWPLMFAQFCFGLGLLLSALTPEGSFWGFVISRGISGIGGGGLAAMSSIVVSDIVSLEERGLFQGYANLNFACGQLIGAPLGAWGMDLLGWRWLFGGQVPFVVVAMWLAWKNVNVAVVPGASETAKFTRLVDRVDFKGSFALVSSITAFLLIVSLTGLSPLVSRALYCVLAVSLASFVYVEKYVAKEQILPLELLHGTLGLCGLLTFLATFAMFTIIYQVPSYIQIVQDQSIQTSASYLVCAVIPSSLGSLIAGTVLKKIKGDIRAIGLWIVFASLALITAACGCMFLIISHVDIYDATLRFKYPLMVALSSLGLGFGMLIVAVLVVIVAIVGREGQAIATGMNYLFRSTAQVLGVGISLSLYNFELEKTLWEVLKDVKDGAMIYEKLLENVEYLKESIHDECLLVKIVNCYRTSIGFSFFPVYVLAMVGLVLSFLLAFRVQKVNPPV